MVSLTDFLLRLWDWLVALRFVALLVAASVLFPSLFGAPLRGLLAAGRRLGSRQGLAVTVCGISGFMVAALLSVAAGIPVPLSHDDFSHLLAAETFSYGRLTNPPLRKWEHFDTFHVLQRPTYASKFPPAQGLTLAAGQVLFGRPIVGIWLAGGLAASSVCWMLLSFVPARWAVAGTLLMVINKTFFEWMYSYAAVPIAVTGGALLTGATWRLMRHPLRRNAWWLGTGLAIVAISRLYEGFVLAASTFALAVPMMRLQTRIPILRVLRIGALAAVPLLTTVAWLSYYNWRVTGHALRLPYLEHAHQYMVASLFIWQPSRAEPPYTNQVIRNVHVRWEAGFVGRHHGPSGLARETAKKLWTVLDTGIRVDLTLPPSPTAQLSVHQWFRYVPALLGLFLPQVLLQSWKARVAFTWVFSGVLGSLLVYWLLPHYLSVLVGPFVLLMVQTARFGWIYGGKLNWRRGVVGATVTVLVLFAPWNFLRMSHRHGLDSARARIRDRIERSLSQHPGRDLIVVRYADVPFARHFDWVHNSAQPNEAEVIWTRDMGRRTNLELAASYPERRLWLLEADTEPIRLRSY